MRPRFLPIATPLAIVALCLAQPHAQAPDRDARLRTRQQEAATLAGERQSLLAELRRLEIDRQQHGIELARTTDALDALTARVHVTAARAGQAARELDTLKPAVRARLVRLYKWGRLGYSRLLLDTTEARAFRDTTRIVATMARRDRDLLDRYRATVDTLATQRQRLDREQAEAATLQARLQQERTALDRAIAARATRVTEIQQREDLNRRLAAELDLARGRLDVSVSTLASRAPAAAPRAAPLPAPVRGGFDWPVPGRILSGFGRERSSRFGTEIARNGIQIATADDAPVSAARDGTVAFADAFAGFGQLVILEHGPGPAGGKTYSLYGHLASLSVVRGDQVQRGQPLGTAGQTMDGRPAVYFELRIDGRPVDPVQWLKR